MPRLSLAHQYGNIVSLENLLLAWQEFIRGKCHRQDVQEFGRDLMSNLISLREDLLAGGYRHSGYKEFIINDPKRRVIHKATVRDRVVHRAIYRILYPYFNHRFIHDSFSCRDVKGTHRAIARFKKFNTQSGRGGTKTVWVLKCDVKKFFASINQDILLSLLREHIADKNLICLVEKIIRSFNSGSVGRGLPLGNLTSQLFANIYLHELDIFIKHGLRQKYYIRYADDFVILGCRRSELEEMLPKIGGFLAESLDLQLHPDKVFIKTFASGVDFLGWVNFSNHRVLRTTTKRRMLKRLKVAGSKSEVAQSYLGLLKHGNEYKLREEIVNSCAIISP